MNLDGIVIEGSCAGVSATLQLARARRRVAVVDAGQQRNRFADLSHGFLGQHGHAPQANETQSVQRRTALSLQLAQSSVGVNTNHLRKEQLHESR